AAFAGGVGVAELEQAVDALGDIIDLKTVEHHQPFFRHIERNAVDVEALVTVARFVDKVEHVHITGAAGLIQIQADAGGAGALDLLESLAAGGFGQVNLRLAGHESLYRHDIITYRKERTLWSAWNRTSTSSRVL